jgi:RNA polymerase sigma factor FliA
VEQAPDPERDVEALVKSCIPLVRHYVTQMVSSGSPLSYDDALGEGYVGLVRAARNYRLDGGSSFSTFASIAIKGAILDAIRRASPLSRGTRRETQRFLLVADSLQSANGREATMDEIAESMGVEVARVQELRGHANIRVLSLEKRLEERSEAGMPAAREDTEERILQAAEAAELRQAIEQLPPREQAIIKGFFFQGRRHQDVAAEMGISESRVSQLQKRALRRIRSILEEGDELRLAA